MTSVVTYLRYPLVMTLWIIALMSGVFSLFRELYGIYSGVIPQRSLFWSSTWIAFILSAASLWALEHKERLVLKRRMEDTLPKPILSAEFKRKGPPQTLNLYLYNSTDCPTVDLSIKDVRVGDKVLRFMAPSVVRPGLSDPVPRGILFNGFTPTNDVYWVVEADQSTGAMTSIFDLKIYFSSLDDRRAKRTWVFSALFWYDKIQQDMVVKNQSIELAR